MIRLSGLFLLTACQGADKAADSAGGPNDSNADPVCPAASDLALTAGQAVPGGAVTVALLDPAAGLSAAWSSDHGEVAGDGAEATWTLRDDLALHLAEDATVRVIASAPGCDDLSLSLTISVDRPDGDRAVVIYDPGVEGSEDVALAYAALHELAADHLCGVEAPGDHTTLSGEDYEPWITAVQACIDAAGPQIHYVVPVYGVPYKVSDRIADLGTGAITTVSLDALLVFGERGANFTAARWNPLYQEGDSLSSAYDDYLPFGVWRDDERHPYYLVSRMDGASAEAALDLVDRAALAQELADAGALEGVVYVDGNRGDTPPTTDDFGSYESGEWNMWGTRLIFEDAALYEVVWDGNSEEFGTAPAPLTCPDALYYAGWYSYYNYNDAFTWAPGAIAGHLDSCSACGLRGGAAWSSNALERGVTATFGAVNEPYVAGMPEYDQLFLYLLQGASYGEAAYEATRVSVWMMVFVGDPLYRPYPGGIGG